MEKQRLVENEFTMGVNHQCLSVRERASFAEESYRTASSRADTCASSVVGPVVRLFHFSDVAR